jgi:glycosyltransferase involved in cell wall biosynthesis
VIGVLTASYPRFAGDSAGVFVRERVRALLREGHVVEVVAAGDGRAAGAWDGSDRERVMRIWAGKLFYAGGAPESLEDPRLVRRLAAWGEAFRFTLSMWSGLATAQERWQAVESHWLVPCGLLACASLPRLPHRAHVHGGDVFLLARLPCGDSLGRILCRSHPELVFASASLREEFAALVGASPESLGARCRIEAAPFDTSLFRRHGDDERQRLRLSLGLSRPTLVGAGRLVPIKGYDVLLAALARIPPAARPDLVLAGAGPEKDRLARQAAAAGVRLQLPGLLAQQALADLMTAADLFVHPCRTLPSGRSEGMPLVVREALACGLPVVASASGGLRELDGTPGLSLVSPDDANALAGAIARGLSRVPPITNSAAVIAGEAC